MNEGKSKILLTGEAVREEVIVRFTDVKED